MSGLLEHCVTLVVQDKLSKPELLAAVSRAADRPIVASGTPEVHVALASGARAEVEVPKFGEDVQLAVDVRGATTSEARALLAGLKAQGLSVSMLGEPA